MFEHLSSRLRAVSLLAVAVLALTAAPVFARPHGGHGGRGGGHAAHAAGHAFRGGHAAGHAFRGGHATVHAFRGGRSAVHAFRGGGFRSWTGLRGYRYGYRPYWRGYGYGYGWYPGLNYDSWPSYYTYPYSSYSYAYPYSSYSDGAYPYTGYDDTDPDYAGTAAADSSSAAPLSPAPDNRAHVLVRVPANAEVWVGALRTTQTGPTRTFVSPPLIPGKEYAYTIRARWMTDSGPQEQTRAVEVEANRTAEVAFPAAVPETLPLLPLAH